MSRVQTNWRTAVSICADIGSELPSSDSIAVAPTIPAVPFNVSDIGLYEYRSGPEDQDTCAVFNYVTGWYKYQATTAQRLRAATSNSSGSLGVYSGDPSALTLVGCGTWTSGYDGLQAVFDGPSPTIVNCTGSS